MSEHPSDADEGSCAPLPGVEEVPCEFGNAAYNPRDGEFSCKNKLIGAR